YARMMVRVNSITMVNLMAGRTIFPEMVSVGRSEPAVDFLHDSVDAMLRDEYYYQSLLTQMEELKAEQGGAGSIVRAAEVLLNQLGWSSPSMKLPPPETVSRLQNAA